jgi:hypothetical protein
MKKYNYDKAKKLIDENKDNILSASLGMHEDWFWTADTIWENGQYKKILLTNDEAGKRCEEYLDKRRGGMSLLSEEAMSYDDFMVNGLFCSDWATPTLQLCFADGNDKMIPCYQDEEAKEDFADKVVTVASKQVMLLGCLSGPVQENITPLSFGI